MSGTLSVVGIGPGDPELLTLKAARIIKESKVLCVPKSREEGSSIALSIVKKAVSIAGKEIIEAHFPMRKTRTRSAESLKRGSENARKISGLQGLQTSKLAYDSDLDDKWNETVEVILGKLRKGTDLAFLTLGDPTVYSTFFYLYDKLLELHPELNIEIIPGVSSVNAAAARAGISLGLGNDRIAVLPANYTDNLKTTLEAFDTVVLMKVNKVFNEVVSVLEGMKLVENSVCISRAGMEDEKIFRDIMTVRQDELNYFSMVIVRK